MTSRNKRRGGRRDGSKKVRRQPSPDDSSRRGALRRTKSGEDQRAGFMADFGFMDTHCTRCGIDYCETNGVLMQCSRCKIAYYCGPECMRLDEERHFNYCGVVKVEPSKLEEEEEETQTATEHKLSSGEEEEEETQTATEHNLSSGIHESDSERSSIGEFDGNGGGAEADDSSCEEEVIDIISTDDEQEVIDAALNDAEEEKIPEVTEDAVSNGVGKLSLGEEESCSTGDVPSLGVGKVAIPDFSSQREENNARNVGRLNASIEFSKFSSSQHSPGKLNDDKMQLYGLGRSPLARNHPDKLAEERKHLKGHHFLSPRRRSPGKLSLNRIKMFDTGEPLKGIPLSPRRSKGIQVNAMKCPNTAPGRSNPVSIKGEDGIPFEAPALF